MISIGHTCFNVKTHMLQKKPLRLYANIQIFLASVNMFYHILGYKYLLRKSFYLSEKKV